MYNFQRRLNLTEKAFKDACEVDSSNHDLITDQLEIFIILARTVTFIMQKELTQCEGFEEWYASKKGEMKEKYQYMVDIRNEIEKEGKSPVKTASITIAFAPYVEGLEKVGTITHYPSGKTEDTFGKITQTRYFDRNQEKEVIASSKEYLDYLTNLVSEAESRFPQQEG